MVLRTHIKALAALSLCCLAAACGSKSDAPAVAASETTAADAVPPASFPTSLAVVGDGFPKSGAPCRRIGESEATADLLDDSADLVACPTKGEAQSLGGKIVGLVDGFTLVSVPLRAQGSGPAAAASMTSPVKAAGGDPIRGKGGLEEKCLARVAAETGAHVRGTNHIEESEAAIEIYVNVDGADAPWKCHGYKNGKIDEVLYTGSEGAA